MKIIKGPNKYARPTYYKEPYSNNDRDSMMKQVNKLKFFMEKDDYIPNNFTSLVKKILEFKKPPKHFRKKTKGNKKYTDKQLKFLHNHYLYCWYNCFKDKMYEGGYYGKEYMENNNV